MRAPALSTLARVPARSRLPCVAAPLRASLSLRAQPLRPYTNAAAKHHLLASGRSKAPSSIAGSRGYSTTKDGDSNSTGQTSDTQATGTPKPTSTPEAATDPEATATGTPESVNTPETTDTEANEIPESTNTPETSDPEANGAPEATATETPESTSTTETTEAMAAATPESTSKPEGVYPADVPAPFAFCFDIDGVLLHSSEPIPGAAEALKILHDNNIPYMCLTNGGGKLESERAAELSEKLGVPFSEDNVVLSHSPYRGMVYQNPDPLYNKTIFVTGQDAAKCREIAESYGFKKVIIPADIVMADPKIFPYSPLLQAEYERTARPLPRPIYDGKMPLEDALRIDAAFVFNDPRDWAVDLQILTDMLDFGRGYLGATPPKPRGGEDKGPGIQLYFSNPDFVWSTGYARSRLGQGAFKKALEAIWHVRARFDLRLYTLGKPYPEAYRWAERMLRGHRAQVLVGAGHAADKVGPLRRVYMVGDNPSSDILGANNFGPGRGARSTWKSILVRTGVYAEGTKPAHRPVRITRDVQEAVDWVLAKERRLLSNTPEDPLEPLEWDKIELEDRARE